MIWTKQEAAPKRSMSDFSETNGHLGSAATARGAYLLPSPIRAFVRTREVGLTLVAVVIGTLGGFIVVAMGSIAQRAHEILFGLSKGEALSLASHSNPLRLLAVLTGGGVLLGLISLWAGERFRGKQADAIEANALLGGRLSPSGSLYITFQTLISNSFGASVGLEAAYTQMCSALASLFGRTLAARRGDMRLLVGCGAAAAIGAAFDAPFAGAFYAFEVILGSYAVGFLAPVVISAFAASLVAARFGGHHLFYSPILIGPIGATEILNIVVIGLLCATGSVLVMFSVAKTEQLLVRLQIPVWMRPTLGGIIVGGMALLTPQVLGAGHGAFGEIITRNSPVLGIALIAITKSLACAISLGSGFRGGLFFASLLIGAIVGRVYAILLASLVPSFAIEPIAASLIGMAAFGTGILGSPFTMICLALELTGDFSIAGSALVACTVTAITTRETFGYTFATWRFHLRGETIRGPQDIGWVQDMRVEKLMRREVLTLRANSTLSDARQLYPLDAAKEVAVVDCEQRYVGIASVAELHATSLDGTEPISKIVTQKGIYLLPSMTIRNALDIFERSEADVLPVVDSAATMNIVGRVSESHALRRYGAELERRNREAFAR